MSQYPLSAINDPRNRDLVIRMMLGEAGNQGPVGQQAVAGVIANRMGQSGQTADQVLTAPRQFEPWGNPQARARMMGISPDSPAYKGAEAQFDAMARGDAQDPTGGATHFYAPKAQAALGRRPPSWDNGTGQDIGDHRFFNLGYGGVGPGNPHGNALARASAAATRAQGSPAGAEQFQLEPGQSASVRPQWQGEGDTQSSPVAAALMARALRQGRPQIASAPQSVPQAAPAGAPPQAAAYASSSAEAPSEMTPPGANAPLPPERPRPTAQQFAAAIQGGAQSHPNMNIDQALKDQAIRNGYSSADPSMPSPVNAPPMTTPEALWDQLFKGAAPGGGGFLAQLFQGAG